MDYWEDLGWRTRDDDLFTYLFEGRVFFVHTVEIRDAARSTATSSGDATENFSIAGSPPDEFVPLGKNQNVGRWARL